MLAQGNHRMCELVWFTPPTTLFYSTNAWEVILVSFFILFSILPLSCFCLLPLIFLLAFPLQISIFLLRHFSLLMSIPHRPPLFYLHFEFYFIKELKKSVSLLTVHSLKHYHGIARGSMENLAPSSMKKTNSQIKGSGGGGGVNLDILYHNYTIPMIMEILCFRA